MTIKTKILWTLLVMSLLVVVAGAFAVNRQRASVTIAATKEAENVAWVLGFVLTADGTQPNAFAQEIVTKLHQAGGRDVVLMDAQKRVLADANLPDVGQIYTDDSRDEVAATIKDGKVRTFVEISREHPGGIKQIVVPMKLNSGKTVGALILEYTPLYNELMELTKRTTYEVLLTAFASLAIAILVSLFMGRSIARPLAQLANAATAFAAGNQAYPLPSPRADEIGQLAVAFNNMMQKRRQAEEALCRARDDSELRVTERTADLVNANVALEWQKSELRVLFDLMPAMVYFKGADNRFLRVNQRFAEFVGMSVEEIEGKSARELFPESAAKFYTDDLEVTRSLEPKLGSVHTARNPQGQERWIQMDKVPVRDKDEAVIGIVMLAQDITERKRLEIGLSQSQKMETVGKLAGGVAHEFNSILTAIIGQSELLLGDLPAGSPLVKNATAINMAAGRAAILTRQLLAYGRKQTLQPEILNLNGVLTGMEKTLHHLLGRGTDVRIIPASGLKAVKADAGQIEEVIMNLAMNAADAMPQGGKLTLETANVTLDEDYVSRFPELKAGEYSMMAISDIGIGMNEEVKARAFEPFFTTKGVGLGTGLGLSTCYGIIKQSGGHISVYTELGRGTTFKIYLPQAEPEATVSIKRSTPSSLPRGTETILLVEDDPALREMATMVLERLGYTVLAAANGIEALTMKRQREGGHIDLLFTDVVMPHMSGGELADRVRTLYPQTKILFTSAYTENAFVHQGVMEKGVEMLQKPFTPSALAHKLRDVLDHTDAPTVSRETVLKVKPEAKPVGK